MDVGRVLSKTANGLPHKTAVIYKDEEITFSQLDLMATRLANKLRACNVGRGDPVAIVLPNSSQWVVSYFAVMRLGAIAVPLDFRFKGEEKELVDEDLIPALVLCRLGPDSERVATSAPSCLK